MFFFSNRKITIKICYIKCFRKQYKIKKNLKKKKKNDFWFQFN